MGNLLVLEYTLCVKHTRFLSRCGIRMGASDMEQFIDKLISSNSRMDITYIIIMPLKHISTNHILPGRSKWNIMIRNVVPEKIDLVYMVCHHITFITSKLDKRSFDNSRDFSGLKFWMVLKQLIPIKCAKLKRIVAHKLLFYFKFISTCCIIHFVCLCAAEKSIKLNLTSRSNNVSQKLP